MSDGNDFDGFDDFNADTEDLRNYFIDKHILATTILVNKDHINIFNSFARHSGIPILIKKNKITPESFRMLSENGSNPFDFSTLDIVVELKDADVFLDILDKCGFNQIRDGVRDVVNNINSEDKEEN